MKSNRMVTVLSSVVCLLPLFLSVAVFNDLPEQMAIQWDSAGNPTNTAPKALAAFGLPLMFMALNIFSKLRIYGDPKRAGASTVMRMLYLWLIPFLSLVFVPITLFMAMEVNVPLTIMAPLFIGILFMVFGNYLPKNRQNYVIGIKLPWTLNDADNWNKTHRLAGYLWILGGMALIAGAFIGFKGHVWIPLSLAVPAAVILIPFFYSYSLYKKTETPPSL